MGNLSILVEIIIFRSRHRLPEIDDSAFPCVNTMKDLLNNILLLGRFHLFGSCQFLFFVTNIMPN